MRKGSRAQNPVDSSAENERRTRLLDALPAIAWSASASTFRFTFVNPAAEKILGYPLSRWLDEPDFWVEHIHPDDIYVAKLCHNETLACRDHELVYRMIAADGRYVWLRDYVNVYSVDGKAVELFGVMVDITRERLAEESSMESRENFRRMVELSPDCIGVYVDGVYVYVNQAFVQLVGAKSDAEIIGRETLSFVAEQNRDRVRERNARVLAGENVPYMRQQCVRIDGSRIDVEVAALPLRYGNRNAVQVIARDITDRVRDEEELRVRETRLQLLASGTHEAIWEWSPDRKELWTNRAYEQLIGVPQNPDTFLDGWLDHVHPDDRENARRVISRRLADDAPPSWTFEHRLQTNDGTERIVLDRGHTVRSASGERRLIGAMLDVTPFREAERLRASAEAKFRWIVEQSVVGVYMMSGDRVTYINDTGAKMLGYTDEALDEIVLPFKTDATITEVVRRDGILLQIACYQNEVTIDGEQIVIGTFADMTESVRARHELEASEQRYRELVEDVSDILFTLDHRGCFVSLSRSFERSTGYRIEEWIGRPFNDLFRAHEQALDHDGRVIREYELAARSGAEVIVEVLSQPRYVDGRPAGTIGTARDVTEHRNISRKLEEAKRMSNLGQVAASLAHEFNNVLMGIQPFIELIARQSPPTRSVTEAIGHITRAISRGKRASQEILRFANPKEPQLFPIEVRTWLPSLLGELAASLPSAITLTNSIAGDVGSIHGDESQLDQVITNLVLNARDAINGVGTIDVSVARNFDMVCITVSDDGPGIAPDLVERIFEPLYTTKRNGTGLGLAIARRLMEGHGGALAAEHRADGGAAFHAYVPTSPCTSKALSVRPCVTPGVRRILIVEDDPSVGAGIELLLRAEGYETTWVRAAAEVSEAARQVKPHVAIIDVNLPDGNGMDLVPLLRAEHKDLPIVLSTGHVELELSDENSRILSLMKPYELTDLLEAITNVTAAA